ncbi:DoxX family protein [Larsenimonas rhizosphaerae]|uniref:DoxX family protein n=1 Tax=Larsenimonas rhizosphaerae TaxID=2944682 RepID=UPI0020337E9A|nr:DoxX family protein [Larsenimonas rhizosphaerae]
MSLFAFANDHTGRLLLRLGIGFTLLLHGVAKVGEHAVLSDIATHLQQIHLPGWLSHGVFVGEIIAPIMLLLGFQTRLAAALVIINMLAALGLYHLPHILTLTSHGGWRIELEVMWLFGAFALLLMGSGRYAIRPD